MLTGIDKLMQSGCEREKKEKICRSRGGESCAFDGAMIVLQPIADSAHIVHGPIACCGNSWEGRGTLSSKGNLHRMGFTTDMSEMDIVYGSEENLYKAILRTHDSVKPKAIFVYATCVSGLIGEDIEAVCKKAESEIGIRVIPVNAPGFVGPKNLGNRIAGEVLLDYVIGTGELPNPPIPPFAKGGLSNIPPIPPFAKGGFSNIPPLEKGDEGRFINLIGEYNIAGDLWLVEPILKEAGIKVLSRITGDSTFEEITYAHRAKLNVVVCSRALINVAKEMERRYGIPYIEVSFFGETEMSKALRKMSSELGVKSLELSEKVEALIEQEEKRLNEKLKAYEHLRGKKAVLYTGGVKSWSFIYALMDLGIEIAAIGTKKSTFEDEEKMKGILGEDALLVEDVTPKNLLKLMREKNADVLVAGGRNQYLAIKEGFPFVDVNQERHTAYAGYEGLINLAEQISNSMRFYQKSEDRSQKTEYKNKKSEIRNLKSEITINPLKHSQSIGAAIAFQGIDRALPIIHGAQGCTFLGKVLLTKHFREPIALASTKLFTENVVMGSEENIANTANGFIEKNRPDVIGILTSGLSEVKGDDVSGIVKQLQAEHHQCNILNVSTPDYEGGLETGYAKAVEALLQFTVHSSRFTEGQINVLVGSHLTPADFTELREIIESFGLKPIMLPDLSALDGSRQGFSALSIGGTKIDEIRNMGASAFTIAIGASMEPAAMILKERFGIEYRVFEGISGLKDTDMFMEAISMLSGKQAPAKYERQRRVLIDGMRDAHFYYGNKKICVALEPDLSMQTAHWLEDMGAEVFEVDTNGSGLFSVEGDFNLLISNSHAEDTAKRLGVPLYQMGFPVYKVLGNNSRVTIGYKGTLGLINDIANLMMRSH
jgi:nitrogenase molybdenum-cofactor synthesis protein NifE